MAYNTAFEALSRRVLVNVSTRFALDAANVSDLKTRRAVRLQMRIINENSPYLNEFSKVAVVNAQQKIRKFLGKRKYQVFEREYGVVSNRIQKAAYDIFQANDFYTR